ncbi:MAG: hypothetical protein JSS69_08320 [Acidobacteria bacterium]|nr:hypothetical protein [Acidobacteriota bacterium]MBS1865909.1 hypothetical protein [Acidobacteriota bacterium]
MTTKIHLAIAAIAVLLAAAFLWEWHAARLDRDRLQSQLADAEKSLQQATASQQQRDRQLTDTVSKLESLKVTVKSQQDILARLPYLLALPKPIAMAQQKPPAPHSQKSNQAASPTAPQPQAVLPTEDLKPLYDFAIDCKACQAKLAAATADLADEKTKSEALSRERDAASTAAKGGSLRQRLGRAAKWFAIGALAGAIAAKSH